MVQLRLDLGCCARGHGSCHRPDIACCASGRRGKPRLYGRSNAQFRKKQRACEQLSFACPPRPDLKQFYRYSFSPVLGFKNSIPSCLILLKLNIWVMELASASNEPWPMRCPPSQLSSTNRVIEVWSVTL